jgi:hypothetical protein
MKNYDRIKGIHIIIVTGLSRSCGSVPGRGKSPFLHSVRPASGTHPASYTISTGAFVPGDKKSVTWIWPFQPNGEVKNVWSFTSTLPYIFVVSLCSTGTHLQEEILKNKWRRIKC